MQSTEGLYQLIQSWESYEIGVILFYRCQDLPAQGRTGKSSTCSFLYVALFLKISYDSQCLLNKKTEWTIFRRFLKSYYSEVWELALIYLALKAKIKLSS